MWILSQWTATSLLLLAYNQTQRRILSIFRFLQLPQYWTFEWWSQTNVVYMRLHWFGEFYIGSTETTVFLREQSRTRKYKQHVAQQLAFFEPAIKLWCKRDNFYQFCIFPVRSQCGDAEHRLSLEQALQQTLRPIYNWPWINPLLKRWRIGKSRFGFTSVNPTVAFGRRLVRRYKKRTRAQHCSLFEQRFDNHLRIFRLLYMLGSDTLMKFECSKLLRSSQADHDYIFLLCRLSRNLTEPFRSRAQQQLKLILQFRNSEFPPANVPVQLLILDDEMESQMRSWLKGFIVHHQVKFPPFHKPKVPFVSIKGRTLGSYLFNFRLHLRWWHPTDRPTCRCHLLPKTSISETPHVSIFAADISGICSVYTAHMEDQVSPSWNKFMDQNASNFGKFLERWKLPSSLMQYWQHFLQELWENYASHHSKHWSHTEVTQAAFHLRPFVTSPADHFPHSLCIHCPCQWHDLLIRTFLDANVFTPCKATPVQTVQQIRNSVPEWILRHYAWGLDFSAKLSTGYILPKPSRMFKKARPIINYSTSWPRKLGQAIGIALLEILNTVYYDLLKLQDVHAALEQIRVLFQFIATDERTFELHQSDIAGFYNQVEHDRILQAVDFAIHRFCALQSVSLESSIQTHNHKSERTLRLFRGHWRSQSKQFREFKLAHIRDLVKFLLHNSFFHVGTQVFRQHRGASMGSQWAPILCSAVALMREYNFFQVYPMLLSQPYFAHRYVDNRVLILPANCMHQRQIQLFWKLDFYTAPILLETVTGNQLFGFCIDTDQRTITFCQPWTQILRSCRGSGASRNIKSGITARFRLILHNVWPSHVRDAQIQDFVGLTFSQFPSLFDSSFREQLVTLCRSFHCRLSHQEIFRFAKGQKPVCCLAPFRG